MLDHSYLERVTLISTIASLTILWVIVMLTKAIRNVYWHPLSGFPGPRLYAACRLPYIFFAFTGRLAVQHHELHKRYGRIVRTAPNELSFIEASAWKTIHAPHSGRHTAFRKNYDSFNETRNQIGHSIFIADDDNHTRMRKVLDYAFSPRALREQEPLIQRHVQELINGLEIERLSTHGMVDLLEWYSWAAFDTVADAAFGEPFKCLSEPMYRQWPILLSKTWKVIVYSSGVKNIIPFSLHWMFPTWVLQKEVNKLDLVLNRVKQRLARKPNRGDLLSSIMAQNGKKGTLTETEIISNASLFVFAGTETVATLLCAVTYLLTQSPQAMASITNEIRMRFQDEAIITIQDLNEMRFLNACINEALRIFPPIAEGLPRIAPPEGATISGEWIPGETAVQISHFAANMSASNFQDPELFVPERWLGINPRYANDRLEASQPFSAGLRSCIGRNLAMAEVRLILARLLWRYDLRCTLHSKWTDRVAYMLWEKGPLPIELTRVR